MAASKIFFKCNDSWYVQVDGLAMGAFLAVILANLWLKVFMSSILPVGMEIQPMNDKNVLCPCFRRKLTIRSKGLKCESSIGWSNSARGVADPHV